MTSLNKLSKKFHANTIELSTVVPDYLIPKCLKDENAKISTKLKQFIKKKDEGESLLAKRHPETPKVIFSNSRKTRMEYLT